MTSNSFCFLAAGRAFAAIHARRVGFPLQSLADGTSIDVPFTRFYLLITSLFIASSALAQPTLEFIDKSYEPQIKTVQLYPSFSGTRDYLQTAAAPIENQNLVLEFDDLQDQRNNYYVKLIHCNYDWTQSTLRDLDFLENFNENPITDYAFSINTHTRYIHYRYGVPSVKIPGNYLLIAYRESPSEIILSKRMLIYHNQVNVTKDNLIAGSGNLSTNKQQFNFDVDYSNIEILNPLETIHVVLRQNQRWDNAKFNVAPSFFRDQSSRMEYRFYDSDQQFDGGNEFRFVDFRSLNFPGQNTGKINKTVKPYELSVSLDEQRSQQAYSQYADLNGNFLIENLDVGEASLTGNYVYTQFLLKASQKLNGEVYLVGRFNNYVRSEENRMQYNSVGYYESQQFLKQGFYNYQYEVVSNRLSPTEIEGSYFQTENVYEVLIYNRPFRPNADLLIGYYLVNINPR